MKAILILTTCPTMSVALKISDILVKKKLAACVQISPPVKSIYRWKGRLCSGKEHQLWIKTRAGLFGRITKEISILHPYEVPEIISISIEQGLEGYLNWIKEQTK